MTENKIIILKPNYDANTQDPKREYLYKCPECDRYFYKVGPLKCHYMNAHATSQPSICIIDSSLICELCNKIFSRRCDLTAHYRKNHLKQNDDPKISYECEICDKEFPLKSTLDNHYHRHADRNKKSLKCDVCSEIFYNLELFQLHCKAHTNMKSDLCDKCQNSSNDPHLQCACILKPYKCEICDTTFTIKEDLQTHYTMHVKDKPFQCEVCFKKFVRKRNLTLHSCVHTSQKPFECDVCGRTFSLRGNLKTHRDIHNNEKNFKCDVCGKLFSSRNILKTHCRIHSNEKPYVCQECNKSFRQRSNLRSHYFTHTQEKPFHCEVCDKCYSAKSKLKSHYIMHDKPTTNSYRLLEKKK